jgi:ATP-dependent helicase/nuclease subunit B
VLSVADPGPGLVCLGVPPESALEDLAHGLVLESDGCTGLPQQTVILAHAGLAGELARRLHRRVGGPCPLPRMFTLDQWLARQPVPAVTLEAVQLVAELQLQLAARPWFAGLDHWAMAAELAALFEELGRNLDAGPAAVLPATAEELAVMLARAHGARDHTLFHLDARLVHDLWRACEGHPEWGLSRWQRDALAMAHLLRAPDGPLWVFDVARFPPQARGFFERYAALQRVTLLTLAPRSGAAPSRSSWVGAALREADAALADRARSWQLEQQPLPPVGICVSRSLGREAEARHACDTVCDWLEQGLQRIAVVACDRALARRLRALLEREGVLADDKAGWMLSTTRVGAAVRDLLRLQRRATPALLRAVADSPLLATAKPDALCTQLGPALDRQPAHARLDWQALERDVTAEPAAVAWLSLLRQVLADLGARPRGLCEWLDALLAALDTLVPGLASDPAGAQLVAHLQSSRTALAAHPAARSAGEFAEWLDWTLGETLFRDDSVQSPVLLTHPAALRGLCFDAILVIGADAVHLPAPGARPRIVRDAARAELGLPDTAIQRAEAAADWCLLMGSAPRIAISWQVLDDRGEPVAASPFVLLMQRFHRLAWGSDLPEAPTFTRWAPASPPSLSAVERAPGVLPAELSPTGYQVLLDCPYRWFVRDGLRLRAPERAVEDTEPSDFGEAVHRVLRNFHEHCPELGAVGRDAALAALETVTERIFTPLLARDFGAAAWLERWRAVAPAYVDWQLVHEAAGWRIDAHASEREVSATLALDAGQSVGLRGRPDRIDRGAAAVRAVFDYKTGSRSRCEGLTEDPTEDAQLVLYAAMLADVGAVTYLPFGEGALDRGGNLRPVPLDGEDLAAAVEGHRERLVETLRRIAAGASLAAMGDADACRYCHAGGLCRKAHRAPFG